jgi:hypothetical protein
LPAHDALAPKNSDAGRYYIYGFADGVTNTGVGTPAVGTGEAVGRLITAGVIVGGGGGSPEPLKKKDPARLKITLSTTRILKMVVRILVLRLDRLYLY